MPSISVARPGLLLILAALLLLGPRVSAVPSFPTRDTTKYRIAVTYSGGSTATADSNYAAFLKTYNLTAAHLTAAVGRPVELIPVYFIIPNMPPAYNGWTALSLSTPVIDAALVLSNTAVCIQKKFNGSRLAASLVAQDLTESESPALFANKDKKFTKLEDVKGRRIAFSDPTVMLPLYSAGRFGNFSCLWRDLPSAS